MFIHVSFIAFPPALCYTVGMLDWESTMAIALAAFLLPFALLFSVLRRTVQRLRSQRATLEHLRRTCQVQEEHLRTDKAVILEALGVPFLLVRRSGRLIMANNAAGELLNIDTSCNTNLLWVLQESELHDALSRAVGAGEPSSYTIRHPFRGEERIFRMVATPLEHPEQPIGVVFHDITEEQRAQTVRRDFVANASHELRTPLTLIRGYVESLTEDRESAADEQQRTRALRVMQKHVDRMVQLVEDMLTISRLENAEAGLLKHEPFALDALAEDVLQRLESLIAEHGTKVVREYGEQPFLITGDRFYWSQILFNLLENALKNNPHAGLCVTVSLQRNAGGTQVCISDNGVGIEPEALPFIFNRFYRADRTGRIKGTGLGLAIVRHAAEAHGGTVKAESEPGVRTTFRITLPR